MINFRRSLSADPGRLERAVAQAFVHSLTVEAHDKILPKFEIRRGLVIGDTGEHDGNPSQGRGVRAMTPTALRDSNPDLLVVSQNGAERRATPERRRSRPSEMA